MIWGRGEFFFLERVSTEWGIEFLKEVEDFEKEMKRSAKMRGF